jgi:hypothetical protein
MVPDTAEEPSRQKPPRLQRVVGNLILLCACLGVGCLIVEGGLRWAFFGSIRRPEFFHHTMIRPPHPTRGWSLAPNSTAFTQTLDFAMTIHTNSKGFRDREHEYEPAPGMFRVMILGDSFMEAYQMDMERGLPRSLEHLLADRDVEVINLAQSGYGTGQEYLMLKEEGLKYKPDLVLMAFYTENDIRNDSETLETMIWGEDSYCKARPYPRWDMTTGQLVFRTPDFEQARKDWEARKAKLDREDAQKRWWQRSMSYAVLSLIGQSAGRHGMAISSNPNVLFGAFLDRFDPEAFPQSGLPAGVYAELWENAWETTRAILSMTNDLARAHGARFAVFTAPARIQVDPDYLEFVEGLYPGLQFDMGKMDRRVVALGAAAGFPVLDLTPAFRKALAQGKGPFYFRYGDRHWNAAAHRFAGQKLAEWLDAQGLIPKPPITPVAK